MEGSPWVQNVWLAFPNWKRQSPNNSLSNKVKRTTGSPALKDKTFKILCPKKEKEKKTKTNIKMISM